MLHKTIILQTVWLAGAFGLATVIGLYNARTSQTPEAEVRVTQASDQEPGSLPSATAAWAHEVDHHHSLKQSCHSCHQATPATPAGNSPHLFELPDSSEASESDQLDLPFLGIHACDVSAALRKHLKLDPPIGAIVEMVLDDSPADHCGIEPHDVIVAIDQQVVHGEKGVLDLVRSRKPGSRILIELIRQGEKSECEVVLGKRKSARLAGSFRIHGCPAQPHSTTNCRDCHEFR